MSLSFDIHSHPDKNGTKGASGYRGKDQSYYGDMAIISRSYKKLKSEGLKLPPHYVYHRESKTLYEYTPWNPSINRGVIIDFSKLISKIPK
ncbi:hypothetical protein GCM10009118_14450 [Wandonia haliotis]|uniref:Uncharacterized protein n=1 Tax=Wandonia haliotis TaxID=574963 RepID=A0ABN1MP51_9FLAO